MARVIATSTSPTLLTQRDQTKAIQRYARKHGMFARTVRDVSTLRRAALDEFKALFPEKLVTFAVYNERGR